MNKKYFILLFVSFSILLHLGLIFWCSFYIEARSSPVVYAWTNLIGEKDLFFERKPIQLPAIAFTSYSGSWRRDYFSNFIAKERYFHKSHEKIADILPYSKKSRLDEAYSSKEKNNYIHLWDREVVWLSGEDEVISYRTYVSKRGKVIFLYPEKLLVDSDESLNLQAYLRESTLFFDNKFFWTKLEVVVK